MPTYVYIYIYSIYAAVSNGKWKTEAQAIFFNPFRLGPQQGVSGLPQCLDAQDDCCCHQEHQRHLKQAENTGLTLTDRPTQESVMNTCRGNCLFHDVVNQTLKI
jgi:hypothetical protein